MLKYRRCLNEGDCNLKAKDPMTGAEGKRCLLTSGTCKHQGCQMIMPTTSEESAGRLIIDALEGKFDK